MSDDRCESKKSVAGLPPYQCERPYGHGGDHKHKTLVWNDETQDAAGREGERT